MDYSFIIRAAQKGDAKDIQEILKKSFPEYMKFSGIETGNKVEALSESLEEIEADIKSCDVFIALMDGKPVGTVRVAETGDSTAILTRLGVVPGYHNIGIGKSLMNFVDKVIASKQLKTLHLYTAAKNTDIMRFYYGRGFYVDSTNKDRGYIRALMVKDYA